MKRGRGLATAVASFLAGGLIFGVVAVQAAPQEDRPFDAVLEGTSTAGAPNQDGTIPVTSAGDIRGTHIGNGSYAIEANQDYDRLEGEQDHTMGDCAFLEDDGDGFLITAANGDQITGNIDNDRSVVCVSVPGSNPPPDDAYLSTIYVQVTGGTGRFEDASGWLFVRGTSTLGDIDQDGVHFDDTGVALGDIDY